MVFNSELANFGINQDPPKIILVADNPGEKERKKGKYLFGPAGKVAEAWFQEKMGLVLHRDILVLNKTPISTPKTSDLRAIPEVLLQESERKMADLAWKLTAGLPDASLWIVGLSHFGRSGIFAAFCDRLKENARQDTSRILLFPHFSHGHFQRRVPLDACERNQFGETTRLRKMGF